MITTAIPELSTSLEHLKKHNTVIQTTLEELRRLSKGNKTETQIEQLVRYIINTRNLIEGIAPALSHYTQTEKLPRDLTDLYIKHNSAFIAAVNELVEKKMGDYISNSKIGKIQIKELIGNIVNQEAFTIGELGQWYKTKKASSK